MLRVARVVLPASLLLVLIACTADVTSDVDLDTAPGSIQESSADLSASGALQESSTGSSVSGSVTIEFDE